MKKLVKVYLKVHIILPIIYHFTAENSKMKLDVWYKIENLLSSMIFIKWWFFETAHLSLDSDIKMFRDNSGFYKMIKIK